MSSKIKIFIGILLIGIILASGCWLWKEFVIKPKGVLSLEKCIEASSFADYYGKAKIPYFLLFF